MLCRIHALHVEDPLLNAWPLKQGSQVKGLVVLRSDSEEGDLICLPKVTQPSLYKPIHLDRQRW